MAPVKFDEKLREKLEERTITPSEMTWDKLDGKLDALEKKNNKKPFWWLGIAASFIGVLLISNFFFKADTVSSSQDVIVDIEGKLEPKEHADKIKKDEEKAIVDKKNETQVTNNKTEIIAKRQEKTIITKVTPKDAEKQEQPVIALNKSNVPLNTSTVSKNFETKSDNALVVTNKKGNESKFETQKINEVVAQIQELKASKSVVTDAEIEALLNNAERDILKNRSKTNVTRVVDANSLLLDVENELDQSFRDRVFETIKSGYKTVRTAVVERKNN